MSASAKTQKLNTQHSTLNTQNSKLKTHRLTRFIKNIEVTNPA